MQDFMVISQPRQIKAIADEKRIRLLDLLVERSATVAQLAAEFGEAHAKVYYHVKELERAGLVEMVEQTARSGAAEKHYRAKARTYLLGRALGQHGGVEQAARCAVEADLLRWRREHVLGVDYRAVAAMVVNDTLGITPGERVLVDGGPHQLEFLEALVLEVWNAGGDAVLQVMGDRIFLDAFSSLSAARIDGDPVLKKELYRNVDCIIALDPFIDESPFLQVPEDRIQAWRRREAKARAVLQGRTGRTIWIGFPTPALADMMSTRYTILHDLFWRAMNVNPSDLRNLAQPLMLRYRDIQRCRLVSGEGGHLLEVTLHSESAVLDGSIPVEPHRWRVEFLPAGELRLPVACDAGCTGTVAFRDTVIAGQPIRDLTIRFKSGMIEDVSASEGAGFVRSILEGKNANRLGWLSIGFNPAVPAPVGYELLDMVADGAITAGFTGDSGSLACRLTVGEGSRIDPILSDL